MPQAPPSPAGEVFEYVLKRERGLPKEQQTIFGLRTLSYREKEYATGETEFRVQSAKLKDRAVDSADYLDRPMATARRTLNMGLEYFKNWPDGKGGELAVEATGEGIRRELSDATLDAVEPYAFELAEAITEHGTLTTEQQKN